MLQVQAALTDPHKANVDLPAQQASGTLQQLSRPQSEASQGLSQAPGLIQGSGYPNHGAGPQSSVSAAAGYYPAPGALIPVAAELCGEGGTPAGGSPLPIPTACLECYIIFRCMDDALCLSVCIMAAVCPVSGKGHPDCIVLDPTMFRPQVQT